MAAYEADNYGGFAEMAWVYRLAYISLLPELHENFPPGASPNLRILEVWAYPLPTSGLVPGLPSTSSLSILLLSAFAA